MKMLRILVLGLVVLMGCAQKKQPLLGDSKFQQELNAEFKDASTSPLKDKDRKNFKGLEFFPVNEDYLVKATLEKTPNSSFFNMQTTTTRVTQERIFGVLTFKLNGKEYQLNVYQNQDFKNNEGLEDYLFLPFLDDTNGDETYGGGRYIDLRIPEGNTLEIDFNTAYNPYCAYNEKYSCPIVPRENYLNTEVKAGVKVFHHE